MKPFTERTLRIIKAIPEGRVMTYGQVARLAGSPRAARQVVRVLHSMSQKHNLPWHRVVNAEGMIAIKVEETAEIQRMTLETEGIIVFQNKINLNEFQAQDKEIDL